MILVVIKFSDICNLNDQIIYNVRSSVRFCKRCNQTTLGNFQDNFRKFDRNTSLIGSLFDQIIHNVRPSVRFCKRFNQTTPGNFQDNFRKFDRNTSVFGLLFDLPELSLKLINIIMFLVKAFKKL